MDIKNEKLKETCSRCHKLGYIKTNIENQKICLSCYRKYYRPKKQCHICNTLDIVEKSDNGKPICPKCYEKYYRVKRKCSICSETNVIKKIDGETLICKKCYEREYAPKKECAICSKIKKIHKNTDFGPICNSCYSKVFILKAMCSNCNTYGNIVLKRGNKFICSKCYEKYYKPQKICSVCGASGKVAKETITGQPICSQCYNKYYRPLKECSICGELKSVHKVINDKPICDNCYYKSFTPKSTCSICNKEGRITLRDGAKVICSKCYSELEGTCSKCGNRSDDFFHSEKLCHRCWYRKKSDDILLNSKHSFNHIELYNLLSDYVDTLFKCRVPLSAFTILEKQYIFIKQLDENIELLSTNSIFISALQSTLIDKDIPFPLSNFFIQRGILKSATEKDNYSKFCHKLVKEIPEEFNNTLLNYANYLQAKSENYLKKGLNKFKYRTCVDYLRASFYFLCYVSTKISVINELSNEFYYEFCAEHNYIVSHLNPFIKWINHNIRLFKKIKILKYKKSDQYGNPYSEEELYTIIDFLSNSKATYRDKLLCLLLIFYAIRPHELNQIKVSDIKRESENLHVFIRNKWIQIHPVISEVLINYLEFERTLKYSLGNDTEWIFGGVKYNTPLSTIRIKEVLREYSISSKRGFSTCIFNSLNTNNTIPAALISGLGLNISTVLNYYKLLNKNASYEISSVYTHNNQDIKKTKTSVEENNEKFYIYILLCSDGSYYTGYTSDIQKRIQEHLSGNGCTYTRTRTPVELVYSEEFTDKAAALRREKQIKKLTIFEKEQLISKARGVNGVNPIPV